MPAALKPGTGTSVPTPRIGGRCCPPAAPPPSTARASSACLPYYLLCVKFVIAARRNAKKPQLYLSAGLIREA